MSLLEQNRRSLHRIQMDEDTNTGIVRRRNFPDCILIWLDTQIDETKSTSHDIAMRFRSIVNTVRIFTDADQCVDYITQLKNGRVFMVISTILAKHIVPQIHDVLQLDSIYMFCKDKMHYDRWTSRYPKVKDIYTNIDSICQALKQAVRRYDQNFIPMCFMPNTGTTNSDTCQIDQSFMYSQLFKEIILEVEYDSEAVRYFVDYCRIQYNDNLSELEKIGRFEHEYSQHTPIWWYTCDCFLYSMLNRALRNLEIDTLLKMGFFIGDLHRHINQLHMEQSASHQMESFTVYRGQRLSNDDLEKLLNTKGGLISFNNFLSTSKSKSVAQRFSHSSVSDPDTICILFIMRIDPNAATNSFAFVGDVGYFHDVEEEVLFSTHTIFRIDDIEQINAAKRFWQVQLTLTTENNQQFSVLIDKMREEILQGPIGWYRLGQILIKLGQFEQAEAVYQELLANKCDEDDKAAYYHQLGYIKNEQSLYSEAVSFYQQSLDIRVKKLPFNDPLLVTTYNNIAVVYENMRQYPKALSFFRKLVEIHEQDRSHKNASLGTYYNNMGSVYESMGNYEEALSCYVKAQEIDENILPHNHPDIATVYNNIGSVYENMKKYTLALSFYKRSLNIREQTLPPNHHLLGASYSNISSVYKHMGDYFKALTFYEKYMSIHTNAVPSTHSSLPPSFNYIAFLYDKTGDYAAAYQYYTEAFKLLQRALPLYHSELQECKKNIEEVREKLRPILN